MKKNKDIDSMSNDEKINKLNKTLFFDNDYIELLFKTKLTKQVKFSHFNYVAVSNYKDLVVKLGIIERLFEKYNITVQDILSDLSKQGGIKNGK